MLGPSERPTDWRYSVTPAWGDGTVRRSEGDADGTRVCLLCIQTSLFSFNGRPSPFVCGRAFIRRDSGPVSREDWSILSAQDNRCWPAQPPRVHSSQWKESVVSWVHRATWQLAYKSRKRRSGVGIWHRRTKAISLNRRSELR